MRVGGARGGSPWQRQRRPERPMPTSWAAAAVAVSAWLCRQEVIVRCAPVWRGDARSAALDGSMGGGGLHLGPSKQVEKVGQTANGGRIRSLAQRPLGLSANPRAAGIGEYRRQQDVASQKRP